MTKNLIKYLSMALAMLLAFSYMPINSFAASFDKYSLDDFIQKIQISDTYKEYSDEIELLLNKKEVDGDGIHRKTVQYLLKSKDDVEKTLVFVGDEELKYHFVGIIEVNNSYLRVSDVLNNTSQLSAITPDYNQSCETFRCTKEEYRVDPDKDFYCSYALGELCNYFSPFMTPVQWLVCQGGVIVGCKVFSTSKVCVEGRWYPVCEY